MVYALHRDGGIGNGVSLQITDKALHATVNLDTQTDTHTSRITVTLGVENDVWYNLGYRIVILKDGLKDAAFIKSTD